MNVEVVCTIVFFLALFFVIWNGDYVIAWIDRFVAWIRDED